MGVKVMSVGKKLKKLRLERKKTLKEQSEIFGVSLNSVYRWEHDLTTPKKTILKKMADYYGVPFEWLRMENDLEFSSENNNELDKNSSADEICEEQLLNKFQKLSTANKYKILGYIERLYIENLDKNGY